MKILVILAVIILIPQLYTQAETLKGARMVANAKTAVIEDFVHQVIVTEHFLKINFMKGAAFYTWPKSAEMTAQAQKLFDESKERQLKLKVIVDAFNRDIISVEEIKTR